MKIALGLFHFNIQDVAGEPAAYHRYCTQVVLPFLRTIASRKEYRITFEMAGNGLEFLSEHYPDALDLLRDLIADRQIELVSSTYAPTLWVGFPRRDLERSIQLNRRVLDRLGLQASKIFSAQEGFFGPGLEVVSDWFDVAICKDDTLRVFANGDGGSPVYRLGKLIVVIGANHLLDDMAASVIRASQAGKVPEFSSFYEAHIQDAVNTLSHSSSEYIDGNANGLQWHWYHLGRAHHFTTTGVPQNWESFFCDPEWMALTCGVFEGLLKDGYLLGFISEFARRATSVAIPRLPKMIESSWNPTRSGGVFSWMGRQEQRWQNGNALLSLTWRARKALRQSEVAVKQTSDENSRSKLGEEIDRIWQQQILAESSDPLGCSPLPCEVNFVREQGDRVLQMCDRLALRLGPEVSPVTQITPPSGQLAGARMTTAPLVTQLVGAEGSIDWRELSDGSCICEARFRADAHRCGLRFKTEGASVAYCPTGQEERAVVIALEEFHQPELYLPLANGFLSLQPDLHLIRDNCSVAVAAHVSKREPWVTFAVEGNLEGRLFEWRFLLLRGTREKAIEAANRFNYV